MTATLELLLLFVVALDLFIVATGRLNACVRAVAWQGAALAALPWVLEGSNGELPLAHRIVICVGTLVFKAGVVPYWLLKGLRKSGSPREVHPLVSLHLSLLFAAGLTGISFVLAVRMPWPVPLAAPLVVASAFTTLFIGFMVLIGRKHAVSQMVGYLLLENGVFIFGLALVGGLPLLLEVGMLLDVLVGVLLMGLLWMRAGGQFAPPAGTTPERGG